MQDIKVQNKTTLLRLIAGRLQISGSQAKKLLDARLVFVNKRRVWIAGYKLLPGDIVEINAEKILQVKKPDRVEKLYEDEQYLIFNKPAGLPTNGPHSFEHLVRMKFHKPALTAVHRLDKDTSGCLIVAKSKEIFEKTKEIFKAREIKKVYMAIATGKIPQTHMIIKNPLGGREAETKLMVLKSTKLASLLRVEIVTGRKHQIRRHLKGIGHPVIGDKHYNRNILRNAAYRQFNTQLLFAKEVCFINPYTNKEIFAKAGPNETFLKAQRELF
ncbi:RluA family pseudouridine synthase [Candidatus Peregrinibacteria bacterium]|nr:RluA family pseudouridine synthase [Candidatus Peregrinibacteria bacterium]